MAMGNDGCRWVDARLPLLAGGELLGLDRRRVERHLLSCPNCRARQESLHSSLNVLHTAAQIPLDRLDPHRSVWPLVAQQIRESRHAGNPPTWTLPLFGHAWGLRLAVAASLLVLIGAGVVYRYQESDPLVALRPVQPLPVYQPLLSVPPELTAAPAITETAALDEPADEAFDEADDLDTEPDDASAPVGTAN